MIKQLYTLIIVICFCISLTGQSYNERHTTLPCVDKVFSISLIIFTDSLGGTGVNLTEINQTIQQINSQFSPICVSFDICNTEILPNYKFDTLGLFREAIEIESKFNKDHFINVYMVSQIGEQGYLDWGRSTFEGINIYTGGSIIIRKENYMRSFSHELGHFLGLRNTFDTGDELVNGSNCNTGGDRICDTPSDPYRLGSSASSYLNERCEFITNSSLVDANGDYYLPDICNVMSQYIDLECSLEFNFSHEQLKHMAETYLNGPKLMW